MSDEYILRWTVEIIGKDISESYDLIMTDTKKGSIRVDSTYKLWINLRDLIIAKRKNNVKLQIFLHGINMLAYYKGCNENL